MHDVPGLLLINLGTPDAPTPKAVHRYLKEFLSDPRVIDIPAPLRWLLLRAVILPFRPRRSAAQYRKVWLDRGSPLLVHGEDLRAKVQQALGKRAVVALAMRYGRPSIEDALEHFSRHGIRRIIAFPLYPQYSSAATGSSIEAVFRAAMRGASVPAIQVVPPFHAHPAFLEAWRRRLAPMLEEIRPERVYFSYHGLPERQIIAVRPECRIDDTCCAEPEGVARNCYRAQCFATTASLADALGIPPEQRRICFQSRLGRAKWLDPDTEVVLRSDAEAGVRRALIVSPAFVADCLETLEELGIRARELFEAHGGKELHVAPALNADDAWVDAVTQIAEV